MKNRVGLFILLIVVVFSVASCFGSKETALTGLKEHMESDKVEAKFTQSDNFLVKLFLKSFNIKDFLIVEQLNGRADVVSELPVVFLEMEEQKNSEDILSLLDSASSLFWASLDEIQNSSEWDIPEDIKKDILGGLKYEVKGDIIFCYVTAKQDIVASFNSYKAKELK